MKQIVVISGKGGTGKTVLTGAFAALAENAVFADCDVDAADLHLLLKPEILEVHKFSGGKVAQIEPNECNQCGKCLIVCRFGAVRTKRTSNNGTEKFIIDPLSCEGCGVCVWNCLAGCIGFKEKTSGQWFVSNTKYGPLVHARLEVAEENSGKLVTLVRQNAKLIAERENRGLIIIDGPPGIGCPVISSITGTDVVLIVTEPTLSGLCDLVRVGELARHFKIKTFVVVNKYDLNPEMTEKIESYCRRNGLNMAGKIMYDTAVTEAMINGKTIVEYSAGEVVRQIRNIWEIVRSELG